MSPATGRTVLNVALFQAGWFACVLGAASGSAWLGPAAVLFIVAVHAAALGHRDEIPLVAASAALGAVAESTLAVLGLVGYASDPAPAWLAPPWIVAMWANFGITLRHSLGWLAGRPLLAAGLGASGGPLAYYAGGRLGAIDVGTGGLAALALVWALALPFLIELADSRSRRRARATIASPCEPRSSSSSRPS